MKKPDLPYFILEYYSSLLHVSNKEEEKDEERFFPVLPIIRSQVAEVDTSLYSIRKITL